ncbi:hypothetical protein HAT2_00202 [Candidatus Similichlamydia laticola]|uniref:Uncharacterized protein n=1 Tax=Candidatus Similichlamydia laticola TaxID=2170265 RepID=A0A369KIT5_9BACT|nr:hypothetical protein HAT2_00202 [Candidatus Similichlamydia laticola]
MSLLSYSCPLCSRFVAAFYDKVSLPPDCKEISPKGFKVGLKLC